MAEHIMHRTITEEFADTDEDALVAQAKRDPRAFEKLYLLYVQPLFRYLHSRIGSVPEAEDATAQTFLAAFEGIQRYQHEGHFAAWLFSIARYKAMDYFRQRRPQASLEVAERLTHEQPDLLQQSIHAERVAGLSKLIAVLPEEERELIRLRYVADLPFAEIARLAGKNEDAVKKILYRLLARLQSQLEDPNV